MKVLVLFKATPDTEAKIVPSSDGSAIEQSGVKYIINPYDEFAIEQAVSMKEAGKATEVIVASAGHAPKELFTRALAMGCDRAIHITGDDLAQADSLSFAKVLKALCEKEGTEVIYGGKQAIDDDNMHTLTMTAELLGWPHVNVVSAMEYLDGGATVEREVEGGQVEVYDVKYPAVFGANKSLNKPRFTPLPKIMQAKKKPFDTLSTADLGVSASATTFVKTFKEPPKKAAGKIFKGEDINTMVSKVVTALREEAKII